MEIFGQFYGSLSLISGTFCFRTHVFSHLLNIVGGASVKDVGTFQLSPCDGSHISDRLTVSIYGLNKILRSFKHLI